MNTKMTTNSQLLTTEPKTETKQTKQTTRTGTESQKWRSHGGLPVGRGRVENGGEGTGSKTHKWQVENKQGEVKNSMRNRKAKELICMTEGHELRARGNSVREWCMLKGNKGQEKMVEL